MRSQALTDEGLRSTTASRSPMMAASQLEHTFLLHHISSKAASAAKLPTVDIIGGILEVSERRRFWVRAGESTGGPAFQ